MVNKIKARTADGKSVLLAFAPHLQGAARNFVQTAAQAKEKALRMGLTLTGKRQRAGRILATRGVRNPGAA